MEDLDVISRKRWLAARTGDQAEGGVRFGGGDRFKTHLLESLGVAVIGSDCGGRITYCNAAAESLLGWPRAEMIGRTLDQVGTSAVHPEQNLKLNHRLESGGSASSDRLIQHRSGALFPVTVTDSPVHNDSGAVVGHASVLIPVPIAEHQDLQEVVGTREKLIEFQEALIRIKPISGFIIPICSSCKKIRDDKGYWNQMEEYIRNHFDADFSHSVCPECARRLFPEIFNQSRGAPPAEEG